MFPRCEKRGEPVQTGWELPPENRIDSRRFASGDDGLLCVHIGLISAGRGALVDAVFVGIVGVHDVSFGLFVCDAGGATLTQQRVAASGSRLPVDDGHRVAPGHGKREFEASDATTSAANRCRDCELETEKERCVRVGILTRQGS